MKKAILFFVILTVFIGGNLLSAQERIEKELDGKSHVKIEKTVYKYNKKLQMLQDSMNNEKNWKGKHPEFSNLELAVDLSTFLRSVFTKERIKELRCNHFFVVFLVDNQGKILEFKFFLSRAPDVSLKDVHALAKALRKNDLFITRRKELTKEKTEVLSMPVDFSKL